MSIYNLSGDAISNAYDVNGSALTDVYDVDGNEISLTTEFMDTTIITNVYTSSVTAQPQGGCIDDDGNIYACFYAEGKFRKYNLSTGVLTEYSFTPDAYGHANGMTYNPNTDCLYVAGMKATGEVYVFDKSLNLVTTKYAKKADTTVFNCWNIAYDRNNERFITISGNYIYFMDDNFDFVETVPVNISEWEDTRQDIETDGSYIYCLSWSPNHVFVFDMTGLFIKDISNTAFMGEPESMCYDWISQKYYIEGKNNNYVIRQAVFKE